MGYISVSVQEALAIFQGVLREPSVNLQVSDKRAPKRWQNKSILDILNIDWYSYKYRPTDTYRLIDTAMTNAKALSDTLQGEDRLRALRRSFANVWIQNTDRKFSKDDDTIGLSIGVEFWIQTEKMQLLEQLIEGAAVQCKGIRLSTMWGKEERQAILIVHNLQVTDVQSETVCGEMAVMEMSIDMMLVPKAISYSDYEVSFSWIDALGQIVTSGTIPLSSFAFSSNMTPKAVPVNTNVRITGSVNLSRALTFTMVFESFKNEFIDRIAYVSLSNDSSIDNNQKYQLIIKRGDDMFIHDVVIRDHSITVAADASNEVHNLTVVTTGVVDITPAI